MTSSAKAVKPPGRARWRGASSFVSGLALKGLLACLVLAVCLAVGSLVRGDDPKPAAEPSQVDFELLKSLHIAVQVKLNDAGPFRLIFDLGSPVMLISGRAAAEAGLISKEAVKKPAFFGMRGEGKLKKLQIGELVAEDVPVMIMDHPTIKAAAEFLGPLDGIVGYPFFSKYRFTIDYPAAKMTFTPNGYQPQNVMQQMMGRMLGGSKSKKKLIAPAALWGISVDKPDGDDEPGVTITHVYPSSPADTAGLLPGDRLLTLDGRWTDSIADAADAAAFAKLGESITTVVRRGDEIRKAQVTPTLGL